MEYGKAVGIAIRSEMVAAQMTLEDVATEIGMSVKVLGRITRGEGNLTFDHAYLIAGTLGITVTDLVARAERVLGGVEARTAIAQQNTGGTNILIGGDVGDINMPND